MPKFAFSLQRVLDYRRLEERWAEDAFRLARESVSEAEAELDAIRSRRRAVCEQQVPSVEARLNLERYHSELDREEESAQNRLALLVNDEARAMDEWREARIAAEALDKLRHAAFEEWTREETRREQADLDE
ncbi:flagellar export protein FliJ, partial [bacterium]